MKQNNTLKTIRENMEITQKEMAKILNTTQQQYSLYETGAREMRAGQIIKISNALNISADYILGLPENLPYPIRKKIITKR